MDIVLENVGLKDKGYQFVYYVVGINMKGIGLCKILDGKFGQNVDCIKVGDSYLVVEKEEYVGQYKKRGCICKQVFLI